MKVAYIDTLHLFPESNEFLKEVEARYDFSAHVYHPKVRLWPLLQLLPPLTAVRMVATVCNCQIRSRRGDVCCS